MPSKNSVVRIFPWLQLILSILLSTTLFWGYLQFRTPIATAFGALSNSILSVANVIEATAGSVGARNELITSTRQTIFQTRATIKLTSKIISDQASNAPKRADELKAAASLILRTSDFLNRLADGLIEFRAPMGIEFEGVKPLVVMKRPLEPSGNELKPIAHEIRTLSEGVKNLSNTVTTDGVQLGAAFSQLGDQTIKMLEESERALESIQNQDLPRSIKEMRDAAANLKTVTTEVTSISESLGKLVLVAGFLFSGWLFLNSLSMIVLARRHAFQ